MKAIMLAAGTGSRMMPLTATTHKCCLEVGGKSLLTGQLAVLRACGIKDIHIVTGYRSDDVVRMGGSEVSYSYNPFFKTTNSIISVWLIRHLLDDDCIFLNCDVICDSELISEFISSKAAINFAISKQWSCERGYKAELDGDIVVRTATDITNIGGEYGGIISLKKEILPKFIAQIESFVKEDKLNCWYEDVVSHLAFDLRKAKAIYVSEDRWYELDTVAEYEYAKEKFKKW